MKILSPSIARMEKPLDMCAKILNAVGCNSVHIDISLDGSFPGFFGKDILVSGEISLFNCPATIHIFTNEPFRGISPCELQKSDIFMLHVFPNTSKQQISMFLDDASVKNYKPAIALDINSDIDTITPFISGMKAIYVMGIPVATHSLPPNDKTKARLISLRKILGLMNSSCSLGIDGGINNATFSEIAFLADEMVIGGLLFNAPNIYCQWDALSSWLSKIDGGDAS